MSEGHTPGEWTANEIDPQDPEWGAFEIWAEIGSGPPAVISTHVAGAGNAHLIASAPEMYEALKEIVEAVARTTSGEVCQLGDFSAARDALAKASGKEPAKT